MEGWRGNTDFDTYEIQVVNTSTTTTPLVLDATVTTDVVSQGDQQLLTFSLANREQLYFDSFSNRNDIVWSLDGPGGRIVNSRSFSTSDSIHIGDPVIVAVPGDYTLTVSGVGDAVGEVGFRLQRLSQGIFAAFDTPITGQLTQPNSTYIYHFDATAGDLAGIGVLSASDTSGAIFRIIDPFGREVLQHNALTNRTGISLDVTGTYSFLIEGKLLNEGTDTYEVQLVHEGNVPVDPMAGTPLVLGTTTTEIISPGGVSSFLFTLDSDALIYVDALTNTTQLAWSLLGPAGRVVDSRRFDRTDAHGNSNPVLDLIAGQYQLDIASNNFDGQYSFRATDLVSATPFMLGTPLTGELDPANESHLYRFDAVAGAEYFFDVESASDVNNSLYRLIDPFGATVFTANDLRDFRTSPMFTSGTHTVLVEGWIWNSGSDTYAINVHAVDQQVQSLELGVTVNGSVPTP